jgi:arylsulfate sulfotransferase
MIKIISILFSLLSLFAIDCQVFAAEKDKNPTFTKYAPWKSQGQLGSVYVNPYENAPLTAVIDLGGKSITNVKVIVPGKGRDGIEIKYPVSDKAVITHNGIPVFGLYPAYTNPVKVSYELDGKKYSETYRIVTSGINFATVDFSERPYPEMEVVKKSNKLKDNLYLINALSAMPNSNEIVWSRGGAAQYNSLPMNIIVDSNGDIRWYMNQVNFSSYDTLNLDQRGNMMGIKQDTNGDLIFGQGLRYYRMDLLGRIKANNRLPRGFIDYSHDIVEMPNGNSLLRVGKRNYLRKDGNVVNSIRDHIIEVDVFGNVVDFWDLSKMLDPRRDDLLRALDQGAVCVEVDESKQGKTEELPINAPFMDIPGVEVGRNWAHVNAIEYDVKDDSLILSVRHQGVIKIGRDKQVKWILGTPAGWKAAYKDKVLKPVDSKGKYLSCDDKQCDGGFDWPWMQHASNITDKGTLVVFDNGDARGLEQPAFADMKYSRGVEYKINEKNMTVEQIWEYGKERGFAWFSPVTSNIRYYSNTNSMMMFGASTGIFDKSKKAIYATFTEVDYGTKDVLLEMVVKMTDKKNMPYRAEKINILKSF